MQGDRAGDVVTWSSLSEGAQSTRSYRLSVKFCSSDPTHCNMLKSHQASESDSSRFEFCTDC